MRIQLTTIILVISFFGGFSCAKFSDGSQVLLTLLVLQDNSSDAWWADGSAFSYRRKIKFGTSHSALVQYYTASFSMDTTVTGEQL